MSGVGFIDFVGHFNEINTKTALVFLGFLAIFGDFFTFKTSFDSILSIFFYKLSSFY